MVFNFVGMSEASSLKKYYHLGLTKRDSDLLGLEYGLSTRDFSISLENFFQDVGTVEKYNYNILKMYNVMI